MLLGAMSCKKDKPDGGSNIAPPQDTGNVYVICEGDYGNGDASLYLYRPKTDSVFGDIFSAVNNQPLGDVFEDMQLIGNNFFLSINNSNKVVVIDHNSWKLTGTISVPQPRYILPVSSTKAYISSLYSNNVYIINPQTLQVTSTITLPHQNAERMLLYNNIVYACSWDTASNSIVKIDATTDQVIQSIPVGGYAPQEMVLDKNQKLWVLGGEVTEGRIATLTHLDPNTGQVINTLYFPATADPLRLACNNTLDTLYFIEDNYNGGTANNGVYRMPITDTVLPTQSFVAAGQNQYYWGIGIDPVTNYIYIGDPKGFVQKGTVTIYKPDGSIVNQFTSGVGPNGFYFDEH